MAGTIFVVKGISGSGKSSRVFQVIKYLEHIGCEFEDFFFHNAEGKDRYIGQLCKDLGIVFMGKKYGAEKGVERWQGYDSVTNAFLKSEYLSRFLEQNKEKYIFVVEGAGVTQTHRLRPKFLSELGYTDIYIQYYNYAEKEEYLKRIEYRSGEVPKKATMWEKNVSFIRESVWSNEDIKLLPKGDVYIDTFEAPISDFGVKMLIALGMDDYVEEFIKFTDNFDFINKNRFTNFS